ncbi:hypothetical protein BC332_02656 [Capsicum chinense]|nr:hypothetical protein BC332_02656 [Capsicum chinense]
MCYFLIFKSLSIDNEGEERFMSSSNPTMRMEYVGKPMTPKISGDSAIKRVGSSNEDNSKFVVSAEEDVVCSYDNVIFELDAQM